jgi:hypothetical protein
MNKMKNYNCVILTEILAVLSTLFNGQAQNSKIQKENINFRDIYPDTWLASDVLGRTMPSFEEVGSVKQDHRRITGIFYIVFA